MNILNVVNTLRFFSSICSLFHNSNIFGSCIHIFYTGCAKIKKNNCGAKRLKVIFTLEQATMAQRGYSCVAPLFL